MSELDPMKARAAALMGAFDQAAKVLGIEGDEYTATATVALVELLGKRLGGPLPTVERLRTLADLLERQYLN